ncbi:hypothetical protein P7K49_040987, partial [Saguinus oedipus]
MAMGVCGQGQQSPQKVKAHTPRSSCGRPSGARSLQVESTAAAETQSWGGVWLIVIKEAPSFPKGRAGST